MSGSRHTPPSPSSPAPPHQTPGSSSKLPKFLQKSTRDRSKSITDPGPGRIAGASTSASTSASSPESPGGHGTQPMTLGPKARKGSKFLGIGKDKERERQRTSIANSNTDRSSSFDNIAADDADASAEFYMDEEGEGENETPVIVEPPNANIPSAAVPIPTPPRPRPRTNSERPVPVPSPGVPASAPEASHLHAHAMKYSNSNNTNNSSYTNNSGNTTYTSNSSSTSRIGDLPTRLSGWFSHTFSSSSTDLSLPTLIAHSASPGKGKSRSLFSSSSSNNAQSTPSPGGGGGGGVSALLTAAKHGKGHLDKAMRYLLDSDAQPDRCTDPIWLLGVSHPGYEPPVPQAPPMHGHEQGHGHGHSRGLTNTLSRRGTKVGAGGSKADLRASTSSSSGGSQASLSLSQSSSSSGKRFLGGSNNNANANAAQKDPAAHWPPVFYIDFTSRVWLTYRSQFAAPLRDMRLADLPPCGAGNTIALSGGRNSVIDSYNYNSPVTVVKRSPWNWGGEKTWTSDTGWGCMLRTGQSLLANALIHVHLGRDWRRPPYPVQTADYATYVQILTWFLDTPTPEAPFSVHRMALAGKELGTDVGQWFGPSVAAGAIRQLVNSYQDCGLAVSVAIDGTLYQTQVFAASHGADAAARSRSPRRRHTTTWGDRPVLLLLGIRLGIEGVNPIYYDTIKMLYTFPQSVGIAGGRPSSSYYFVGSQADNLFYLDPHNPRPAIPLRSPPSENEDDDEEYREQTPEPDRDGGHRSSSKNHKSGYHARDPTSPSSIKTGSSNFSYNMPTSPSPLQQQLSSSSADSGSYTDSRSPPPSYQQHNLYGKPPQPPVQSQHGRWRSASVSAGSPAASVDRILRESDREGDRATATGNGEGLDPLQRHYCNAYSAAELKTFHCERVRKMPLSGLDPSMLIGFLCRDEADWIDFRKRVAELPRTIFSVQDEQPTWPSDSDDNMGLESISEPDDIDLDEEGDDVDGENEHFFDTHSSSGSNAHRRGKSSEFDTEDDPVGPVTPGPNSKFEMQDPAMLRKGRVHDEDDEDEDDADRSFLPDDGRAFDEDDDIEDDWVDPSVPTPTEAPVISAPPVPLPPAKNRSRLSVNSSSPPSSSSVPPLSKSKSSRSTSSSTTKPASSKPKSSSKGKKEIPVPVPAVRIPSQQPTQEHYPFPVTPADDPSGSPLNDRPRNSSTKGGKRMHTARARDGGRTQSGGVKGILTDD
ncbi:hypothetical protein D9619_012416 [Psilocybe cf. subviscida]|uniref:Autophagy-related protein 4 n=1 Tax=Psilocybe cf. subviscida TaxID=2480587 RepID=A0A8H5ER48_9AGAR|nr:hypothetical protein D9619_012416 [Psilocybe cf. subviscida]